MNSKKTIISIIVVFFVFLIFLIFHFFYRYGSQQSFTCRAWFVQQYDDIELNLSIKFMFKDNYGTAAVNGQSEQKEGGGVKKISREIYFIYQGDSEFYFLTSRRNVKYPDDNVTDAWLSKYLPNFYVRTGQDLYLTIHRQKNRNNLFFVDAIPLFNCKAINGH